MFQNSKIISLSNLAFSACIMVSGFNFLAWCALFVANKNKRVSSLLLLYKRVWLDEYSTNWGPWEIDPHFSREIAHGGGGELGGPNKKNKFPGERSHRRTRSEGGLVRKKISRFEISRGWHLCWRTTARCQLDNSEGRKVKQAKKKLVS